MTIEQILGYTSLELMSLNDIQMKELLKDVLDPLPVDLTVYETKSKKPKVKLTAEEKLKEKLKKIDLEILSLEEL